WLAFHSDGPAVPGDNLFNDGEPNSVSFELSPTVQPLKWPKNLFREALFEADAIVLNGNFPKIIFQETAADLHNGRPLLRGELQSIRDEILKKLPHLMRVSPDYRQTSVAHSAAG